MASRNPGKVAELQRLLGPLVELRPAPQEFESPEETGSTYAENASLKASALAALTGGWTVADDSGLEVDALDGQPGLRSARYAATDSGRIQRLLEELRDTPPEDRGARFCCALALGFPDGRVEIVEGVCEGRISDRPRGALGFGYDPIFEIPDHGTFAELSARDKDRLSHRGRAAARLRELLGRLDPGERSGV